MSKIKDSDIRMNCPDKATCYEHLHNLEVLKAYRKECKLSKKYKECLQEIRDIVETCLKFHKCEKCKFYKECQYDLEEYILDKINEVIGAE